MKQGILRSYQIYVFSVFFLYFVPLKGKTEEKVEAPSFAGDRYLGLGDTYTAVVDDRLALYYNPAGLNLLEEKITFSVPAIAFKISRQFFPLLFFLGQQHKDVSGNFQHFILSPENFKYRTYYKNLANLSRQWNELIETLNGDLVTKNLGVGAFGNLNTKFRNIGDGYWPLLYYQGGYEAAIVIGGAKRFFKIVSTGLSAKYLFRSKAFVPKPLTAVKMASFDNVFDQLSGVGDSVDTYQMGLSFDAGLIYHLGSVRIGLVLKDIFGKMFAMDSDSKDESIRWRFDSGIAYHPAIMRSFPAIRDFIVALDLADLFNSEKSFMLKLNSGIETIFPAGAIRLGLHQGYPTLGFTVKLILFNLNYTYYGQEGGLFPGQIENQFHLFSIHFGK